MRKQASAAQCGRDAVVACAHGHNRDRGADEGGDGVQAAGEHGRNAAHQHVADRSAADGGDGPENDGLCRAEPVFQGLGGTSDAEQAQPGRVGQLDGQGVPVQGLAEEERDECPGGGYRQVAPVAERGGR